jgi:hypothetical protein
VVSTILRGSLATPSQRMAGLAGHGVPTIFGDTIVDETANALCAANDKTKLNVIIIRTSLNICPTSQNLIADRLTKHCGCRQRSLTENQGVTGSLRRADRKTRLRRFEQRIDTITFAFRLSAREHGRNESFIRNKSVSKT